MNWDLENRLTNLVISAGPTLSQYSIDFLYDYLGRRVRKIVSTNNGSAYFVQYTNKYVYDFGQLFKWRYRCSSFLEFKALQTIPVRLNNYFNNRNQNPNRSSDKRKNAHESTPHAGRHRKQHPEQTKSDGDEREDKSAESAQKITADGRSNGNE